MLLVAVTETWRFWYWSVSWVSWLFSAPLWQSRDDLTGEVLGSAVCELLVVNIHQLNTVVAIVYRPPDTKLSEFHHILTKLDSLLCSLPSPTPNRVLMGDLNFRDRNLSWIRSDDGILVPVVHEHRQVSVDDGPQIRQQAARIWDLALKHNLTQFSFISFLSLHGTCPVGVQSVLTHFSMCWYMLR